MKRILLKTNGRSLIEILMAVAVIALLVVFSLPVIFRVVSNIKDQTIISSLYAILEAQKSYRDAQTPTTYANTLQELMDRGYLENLPRGILFTLSAVDQDAFTAEARVGDTLVASINQNGNVLVLPGGSGGGRGGGGDGGGDEGILRPMFGD